MDRAIQGGPIDGGEAATTLVGHRVRVIEPPRGWTTPDLGELVQHRELLYFLMWRDIKVRYKQTAIGAAWAVLQPLLLMIAFTLFLGRVADIPSGNVPYPVFAYTGLVAWTLFAQAAMGASGSLVGSISLVSKVYFPRIVLPMAAAGSFLLDFLVALSLLVVMMALYGVRPGIAILWLPAFVLLIFLAALGVGIWLSAINARYRDVQHAVPFLIQMLLFASPIAYSSEVVPASWRLVYGINPVAGAVEGIRWSLLGTPLPTQMVGVSSAVAVVLVVAAVLYFAKAERTLADVI